jgi:hypothetical protein
MKNEQTGIPEFQSLGEERKYWEARGPLAEGHSGRLERPERGQKRSSFLAVRLTGEELTRLREVAAGQGLGPSTFARLVLTRAVQNAEEPGARIPLDELKGAFEGSLPLHAREKAGKASRYTAGDPDGRSATVIDATQRKRLEELTSSFLAGVLSVLGAEAATPEGDRREPARSAVKSRSRLR